MLTQRGSSRLQTASFPQSILSLCTIHRKKCSFRLWNTIFIQFTNFFSFLSWPCYGKALARRCLYKPSACTTWCDRNVQMPSLYEPCNNYARNFLDVFLFFVILTREIHFPNSKMMHFQVFCKTVNLSFIPWLFNHFVDLENGSNVLLLQFGNTDTMADMSVWNCPAEIFVSKHNLRWWYFTIFLRCCEGKFPVNPDFTETD